MILQQQRYITICVLDENLLHEQTI